MMHSKGQPIKKDPINQVIKEFITEKKFILPILSGLLLFLMYYFLILSKNDLTVFPSQKNTKIEFFTDAVDNGNSSIISSHINTDEIYLEFVLKNGFLFPYTGMEITNKDGYFDLSDYNSLEINVAGNNLNHVVLYLNAEDKNVLDKSHRLALRRLSKGFEINAKNKVFNMADFQTPDWWYNVIHQSKTDFEDPEFDKVKSIMVSTGVNPRVDTPGSLTLHTIRFYRNNFPAVATMIMLELSLILSLFLVYLQQKKNRIIPIPTPLVIDIRYKAIQADESRKINASHQFLDYIHQHYAEPELSLKEVAKAVGVNERTISDTIAQKFACNFKTYINQIRIAEAKRLLLSSDLRVSEIAYKVGFNSPVNFNRVFKTIAGLNPSDFLSKNEASMEELV